MRLSSGPIRFTRPPELMRLEGRASCNRCLRLVRRCELHWMEHLPKEQLYCGSCRRALRALSRLRKGDDGGELPASKVRTDEQWLRSKAHDAAAYRKTMALFGCETMTEVRALPFERRQRFHQAWTRVMIQTLPDDQRTTLRESMERRQGRTLPELFDLPPEALL